MKNTANTRPTPKTRRPAILPTRDAHAFLPAPCFARVAQLAEASRRALPSLTPAPDASRPPATSNRDTLQLEFAATRTKQGAAVISNRDKNTTSPDTIGRPLILNNNSQPCESHRTIRSHSNPLKINERRSPYESQKPCLVPCFAEHSVAEIFAARVTFLRLGNLDKDATYSEYIPPNGSRPGGRSWN